MPSPHLRFALLLLLLCALLGAGCDEEPVDTPEDTLLTGDTRADTEADAATEDTIADTAPADARDTAPDTADTAVDTADTAVDTADTDPADTRDTTADTADASDTTDVGTACAVGGRAGTCLDVADCAADDVEPVAGYCPGPAEIQCCVERRDDTVIGTACATDDGRSGTCEDTSVCTGALEPIPGFCPGPSTIQCCVESDTDPSGTPCQIGDISGTCLDISECTLTSTPGYCPGPSTIQCCSEAPPDTGGDTCDPLAFPRPNEGLTEAPGVGGCPDGMIPVEGFCVDRFEAALVHIESDGSERSWSPYFNPGDARVRAISAAGAVPQGYIDGEQAAAACAEAGKRLCTNTEWLRACRSAAEYTYPYGDTRQPGVCNDARSIHPAVEYFGSAESWVFSRIDHPCLNQLDDGLALTGDHPGCVTTEGAFDMMGNLHEWTSDATGTFRGGFYVDTVVNGNGCLYRTTAHNTLHWDYSTGFRCCADLP